MRTIALHLLLERCSDLAALFELLLALFSAGKLGDLWIAFITFNVRTLAIFLIKGVLFIRIVLDLILDIGDVLLDFLNEFAVFTFKPSLKVVIDVPLLLRYALLVNYLRLHGLDEALKGIKLRLGLHSAQFAHRLLLLLHLREGTVHRLLDVLTDQSRALRRLISSLCSSGVDPLLRVTVLA